jgi:hypothetical protein
MCILISRDVCVVVILTMATKRTSDQIKGLSVTSQREFWYNHSLNLWNQDDTIRNHLIAVENSGAKFGSRRNYLEVIGFQHNPTYEIKHCKHRTKKMGEHELISLHEAMHRAKRMRNATHVLKVTGRYYIPGLVNLLRGISPEHEIIHMHGYAGGCEVMGCRVDICPKLWACPYERFSNCEATIKTRMQKRRTASRFELPQMHTAYTLTGTGARPVASLPHDLLKDIF